MDICYIILGHKNPEQIRRLVKRLLAPNTFFYVHIDRRVEIGPFVDQLFGFTNLILLDKREEGTWGDIGIVKATLHALKQILQDRRSGYCVLLSGQDYPLQPTEQISDKLENSGGANFADTWSLPYDKWFNGGFYRIQYYKYNVADGDRDYLLLPPIFSKAFYQDRRRNVKRVVRLLRHRKLPIELLKPRQFPNQLKPYGGSQWWAITTKTARQILFYSETHKNYLRFHKFTLLADEIFFQTLIMHFSALENVPVHPSLTYLRWESGESAHPLTFSQEHAEELHTVQSQYPEKLFARKFNSGDPVLTIIDGMKD